MKHPSHTQPASGPESVPAHVAHLPAGGAGVAFVHAAQVKGGAAEGPSGVDSRTDSLRAGDDWTNERIEANLGCTGAVAPPPARTGGSPPRGMRLMLGELRGDLLGLAMLGVAIGRLV